MRGAARAVLEEAVRLGPELAGAWVWLAQASGRLHGSEARAEVLARAAQVCPEAAEAARLNPP